MQVLIWIATAAVTVLGLIAHIAYALTAAPTTPVLAYVTDDSFPYVPRAAARIYMMSPLFDPRADVSGIPLYQFLLNSYGSHGADNDARVLELSRLFLSRCVDIDAGNLGFTPLSGAVLGNASSLVRHLVTEGADTTIRISRPGSKIDGLSPEQLAQYLATRGRVDLAPMLEALHAKPNPSVKGTSCGKPQSAPLRRTLGVICNKGAA